MGHRIRVSSGVIAALLGSQSALAQEDAGGGLQEVVVTAQRREENTQRAPIAITALAADQLAGTTEATDLSKLIPAVQIGPSQGPQPLVYLRGVGSLVGNSLTEPAVIFSLDGVPLARPYQGSGQFFGSFRSMPRTCSPTIRPSGGTMITTGERPVPLIGPQISAR